MKIVQNRARPKKLSCTIFWYFWSLNTPIHSFFSTKRLRTSFLLIILRKIISVVFNLRVLEKNTTKKYSKKSFEPKKSCTIEHLSCTKKIVHEKILSCTNREIVHDFFRDFEPWSLVQTLYSNMKSGQNGFMQSSCETTIGWSDLPAYIHFTGQLQNSELTIF